MSDMIPEPYFLGGGGTLTKNKMKKIMTLEYKIM